MNTKILILIGALAATNSYAILISPVSALRTLSISGTAETESYSQTQSSSGLGVFNQSLSGAAETINAIAQSLASQTSSILENGFSIDTLLNGTTAEPLFGPNFGNYFEPPGGLAANASSTFELTFQILEPVSYELGGSFSRFGHDFPGPTFAFSLLSPLGTTILGGNYIGRDITYTGTLLPDTYTFRLLADIHAQKDPLGDQQFIQSSAIFRVAAVPEAGSTLLLLAGRFGMLHFFARKFATI